MTCFGIIPLLKRTPSKSFLSSIPYGSKYFKYFSNFADVKLPRGFTSSSSEESDVWLSWELRELIRVRWWKSNAFWGLDKKQRMKSWNAIELEIIRLTSSYCEYRLVRSITAFWRLRLFLPRERQSSKLFHKLILTLLSLITDVINAYIFESC